MCYISIRSAGFPWWGRGARLQRWVTWISKMESVRFSLFTWCNVHVLSGPCAGDRGIPGSPGLKGLLELCQAVRGLSVFRTFFWLWFDFRWTWWWRSQRSQRSVQVPEVNHGVDFGLCVQRCFLIQLWCHLSRWLWFSWCTWTSWRERSQRVNWWVFWLSDTDNSSLDLMWPQFGPLVKLKSRNAAKRNWNCKQCLLLVLFRIIIQNWAII